MGINNSLLKSMQTIVDKAIDVAPFDKTRQAQIITNNTDGTYNIRLDGILYNNIPSYPKLNSMAAGSIVKIIIPSNQSSQMYIRPPGLEFSILSDSVPIGAIQSFGGEIAPEGWLICDGSAVSREDYADLFTTIGTTYGSGDGSTTFNLPNLKGRVMVGTGESDAVGHTQHNMGQSGGEETHQLIVDEMPSHAHEYKILGNQIDTSPSAVARDNDPEWSTKYQVFSGDVIHPTGGNQSHNNMQPYLVVNYIIKVTQPPIDNVIKTLNLDSLLLDAFRPVGSTYSTTNVHFNPNLVWGGTWERLPEGYILLSGSENGSYQVGTDTTTSGYKEYGENSHVLTSDEIPAHTHGNKSLKGSFKSRRYGTTGDGAQLVYTRTGMVTITKEQVAVARVNQGGSSGGVSDIVAIDASHEHTSFGGGQAHDIMQKSIAVYWWIRVA